MGSADWHTRRGAGPGRPSAAPGWRSNDTEKNGGSGARKANPFLNEGALTLALSHRMGYLFSVGERSRLGCTGRRPRRPERVFGGAPNTARGARALPGRARAPRAVFEIGRA